jgi:Domain of unknown function (DUF4965)/Domain of unknown function (DUF1793)
LFDALARAQSDPQLAKRYWPKLTNWARYLKEKGLDPENQLTTDDFAGHVAHVAKEYGTTAKTMAAKWITMAAEGDHYKLAFDSPATWSQKYNLV